MLVLENARGVDHLILRIKHLNWRKLLVLQFSIVRNTKTKTL